MFWPGTQNYTLEWCILVVSVRKSFHLTVVCVSIWMNIHARKYKCSVCGKCCGSGQQLAVHRRSHSGEKLFECTVCSKRFTQSGHLVVHSRIHIGEKPYKCHVCDKAFNYSGYLDTHMRVHTGDKPYKCHLCDKVDTKIDDLGWPWSAAMSNFVGIPRDFVTLGGNHGLTNEDRPIMLVTNCSPLNALFSGV